MKEMNMIEKRNNVRVVGNGTKTLLFVHGYGCSQNMWRFMVPNFTESYKVVLIDLVGSGKSDVSAYDKNKYSSLRGYGEDILEIIDELELTNVTFIGHSVSSMIGLHASILRPDVFEKMVMIGPSPCYINDQDYVGGFDRADIDELLETVNSNYLGWSSAITPVIMGNSDRPELTEELGESFCQTNPKVAQHFAEVTFLSDERALLEKLETETLILQCTSDIIAPMEVGNYLAGAIKKSTLQVLQATGHCPHMSAPQETSQAILSFLN